MHFSYLSLTLLSAVLVTFAQFNDDVDYHPRLPADASDERRMRSASELDTKHWYMNAHEYLQDKLDVFAKTNGRPAKNIIFFLGAGMSVHTMTATRAFLGNSANQLSFEKFHFAGLTKTYCLDKQIPDGGSAATAYLSGVKANFETIGVNGQVRNSDCEAGQNTAHHTESIAKWAQDAGKWAGLVTTARVTDASPAGVYAHTANRWWDYDGKVKQWGCNPEKVLDIARQLIEWPVGKQLRVILGGGTKRFLNNTENDDAGYTGRRSDGRNLVKAWLADKKQQNARAQYVTNKRSLLQVQKNDTDYLLGLFTPGNMPYHGDLARMGRQESIPSLSEMTEAAIQLLSRNDEGFFLFVEGARIDMAHHATRARLALEETAEFSRAVDLARTLTSEDDTLIVVTADHAHTMTINGYPQRTTDILGLTPDLDNSGYQYTALSYANGPGFKNAYTEQNVRRKINHLNFKDPNLEYIATVPLASETHGGDDVGIFASGPFAHYFSGNYEQSNIALLMAKAAEIGPYSAARK